MGMGFLFMVLPPFCLIWMLLLFLATMGVVFVMDSGLDNNSIKVNLALAVGGVGLGAGLVSSILVFIVSNAVPYLSVVNSEWGIVYEGAYQQFIICAVMSVIIFAVLSALSWLVFRHFLEKNTQNDCLLQT